MHDDDGIKPMSPALRKKAEMMSQIVGLWEGWIKAFGSVHCPVCKRSFTSTQAYIEHIKQSYDGELGMTCG